MTVPRMIDPPGMIGHPDGVLPPEDRPGAYAALVAAIATHEPEALARTVAALEEDTGVPAGASHAAAVLGRRWLGFYGNTAPLTPAAGTQLITFAYPALVGFQVETRAGVGAARRQAHRAVAALLDTSRPLCALEGALPDYPSVLNLEVWLGSARGKDQLTIENVEPAPGE